MTASKRARSAEAGVPIGTERGPGRRLERGKYGHDFIDEIQPLEGKHVVDKPGFGAFIASEAQLFGWSALSTAVLEAQSWQRRRQPSRHLALGDMARDFWISERQSTIPLSAGRHRLQSQRGTNHE